MYSVSAVNEGKFRTVSESIRAALHPVATHEASSLAFNIGQSRPALSNPTIPGTKEVAVRRLRELI
jgi:chemotaxis protein MotB